MRNPSQIVLGTGVYDTIRLMYLLFDALRLHPKIMQDEKPTEDHGYGAIAHRTPTGTAQPTF